MKKTIIITILILFFINCKAQTVVNINTYNQGDNTNKYFKDIDNNYSNFVGTWHSTTGNITFKIIIWKELMRPMLTEQSSFIDTLFGKYLIIQNIGTSSEVILYNSIKYFPQNGHTSNWVLIGDATNPTECGGSFTDTNANNGTFVLDGAFSFEITNLGNTPLQAQWKLQSTKHLQPGESFTVPTDCILTKQ